MKMNDKLSTSVLLVLGSSLPLSSRNRSEAIGEATRRLGPPTVVKLRRQFSRLRMDYADDAVQEFACRIARKRYRYRPEGKPEAWFYRGCERKLLDIIDTEQANCNASIALAETLATGSIYAGAFFKSVAWDMLAKGATLSADEKRIVELHVGEDWTLDEIGVKFGKDHNRVWRTYKKAIRKLKKVV